MRFVEAPVLYSMYHLHVTKKGLKWTGVRPVCSNRVVLQGQCLMVTTNQGKELRAAITAASFTSLGWKQFLPTFETSSATEELCRPKLRERFTNILGSWISSRKFWCEQLEEAWNLRSDSGGRSRNCRNFLNFSFP